MPRNKQEQTNQEALEFAQDRNKKVAPGPAKKAMAIGAVALGTAAGVLGLGKSPEQSQPTDMGTQAGQTAGESVANGTKGAAPEIDLSKLQPGMNTQEDLAVDPATKATEVYENSQAFNNNDGHKSVETEQETQTSSIAAVKGPNDEVQYVDPATGEHVDPSESAEQDQPFITGNDGHKAAKIEQEANNPEG